MPLVAARAALTRSSYVLKNLSSRAPPTADDPRRLAQAHQGVLFGRHERSGVMYCHPKGMRTRFAPRLRNRERKVQPISLEDSEQRDVSDARGKVGN